VIADPPGAVSGVVILAPDQSGPEAGYVVFRIDDDRRTIVNTPPFRLLWNTARVPNGLHHIEISVYDREGVLSTRATRDVRTFNRGAVQQDDLDPGVGEVRAALWRILTPLPSRLALAYAAAGAARALGQTAAEERYLFRAASIEPSFADVRRRLVAVARARATEPVWRGAPDAPVVALTFDDGPKPVFTDQLLAVLAREGVPATFFVIGRHVTANPDLTRRLVEAGMQVENHSYTHSNLTILPPREVERELVRTMATVEASTGRIPRYFRPPGGNTNVEVRRIAAQWGLTACMWTVDGDKFEGRGGDRLVNYMVSHAAPGAILLLHNGRPTTIDALPRIIAGIRSRGLTFVTLDELLRRPENGR
jgi:peptidoglycan/xylan/chitin deacetylase (PgdA/CDA1 family)